MLIIVILIGIGLFVDFWPVLQMLVDAAIIYLILLTLIYVFA